MPEFNTTYARDVPRRTTSFKRELSGNYQRGNSAPYPPGTPLGPPLAPDVLDILPGGKTNYIQPGYGTRK